MPIYDSSHIALGLKEADFEALSTATKKKLIRLMSRVSEYSYRRGFQHGCIQPKRNSVKKMDPVTLRFMRSLDRSPDAVTGSRGMSSKERLFVNYRGPLYRLGI